MVELSKDISDKRVKFQPKEQTNFILVMQERFNANAEGLAKLVGVHPRTIRDWRREKFLMSYGALRILCKKARTATPPNIEIKSSFWYVNKGSKKGWAVVLKKYGRVPVDEEYRKKKWYEWWEKEGKFKKHPIINVCKPFKKPKPSEELAEFIGIMMGDGGMTPSQLCITLHHVDDLKFSKHVVSLIKKLFNVVPSVIHSPKDSVNDILVSRSGLVRYLNSLGLVIGNKVKQRFDIPEWIKQNGHYLRACVRGLVDTDGCLIQHRYKVNGKEYFYKKLGFTTMSAPLRQTVFEALKSWGVKPRIASDRDVRIDSISSVKRYFQIVGSHNQKHLNKYYD